MGKVNEKLMLIDKIIVYGMVVRKIFIQGKLYSPRVNLFIIQYSRPY